MKKIILSICLVLSLFGGENGRWELIKSDGLDTYFVVGDNYNFDSFGFTKKKDMCDMTFMFLSLHNGYKDLEKYNDKFVKLDIQTKKVKFTIKVSIYMLKQALTDSLEVYPLMSTNFLMGKKFIDLLKNTKTIKISINPHQKIAKYFKNRVAVFSLKGFEKAYRLGYNRCIKESKQKVKK